MPASIPSPARYRLFVGGDSAAQTVTTVWMAPGASPGRPVTRDQTPQGRRGSPRCRRACSPQATSPPTSWS